MTLGQPYGIQLGVINVCGNYFPEEVRNKQSLDVILVAHGATYLKPAVQWTQHDVDSILMVGTELYKETKDVNIDELTQLTKGLTYRKHFIQVKKSVPIVEGSVMTVEKCSMDLFKGLDKFFTQHKQGILQTTNLDLYIAKRKAFFVFDPRGRTTDCVRSSEGKAALMVFERLENVYHLILNLSEVNVNDAFKICSLTVNQFMKSKHSPVKFSVFTGNQSRRCRSDDYNLIDDVAYLRGSLHLYNEVFGGCRGKQSLTTAIMAMVYAKIDPPNSWDTTVFDRVLHFGTQLYSDCLQDDSGNLALRDILSKFYVGDFYRAGIAIGPFLRRLTLKPALYCDEPVAATLKFLLETTSFHCFLLQTGNHFFATWQMRSSDAFYFFDGQQKDVCGNMDRSEGTPCLFMIGSIERLGELIVKRLLKLPKSTNRTVFIHGLKIIELTKLSKKEQKCKPRFRLSKTDCVRPMTVDESNMCQESPSTVDSALSPSLVSCKAKIYEEDTMSTAKEKISMIERNDFPRETVEFVQGIHSDILQEIFFCDPTTDDVKLAECL